MSEPTSEPVGESMSESAVIANDFALEASAADIDIRTAKRVLEAVLLASQEPLSAGELRRVFDDELNLDTIRNLLEELRADWRDRGVELVQVASGWRFQTRLEFQKFIERLKPERPVRYSRAVMETLAIVAYRQPVTRGDIENIRGVTVSSQILKTLEARGWVEIIGHKEVPGRPALFATTKALLDDLNLRSLEELPPLTDLEALEAKAETINLLPEDAALASFQSAADDETLVDAESADELEASADDAAPSASDNTPDSDSDPDPDPETSTTTV